MRNEAETGHRNMQINGCRPQGNRTWLTTFSMQRGINSLFIYIIIMIETWAEQYVEMNETRIHRKIIFFFLCF